jgi:hypothetical protein
MTFLFESAKVLGISDEDVKTIEAEVALARQANAN